jgi:hypothetical protein
MLIGGLHEAVGLAVFRAPLAQMLHAGVFDSVGDDAGPRAAAFWFLAMGAVLLLLGWLARWVEVGLGAALPRGFGWGLLALAAFCILPMPATGAWLVVPVGLSVLRARTPPGRKAPERKARVPEALADLAQGADHVDVKTVESAASLREFVSGLMSHQPAWVTGLFRVRRVLVRLLGMRQHGVPPPLRLRPEDVPMRPGMPAAFFQVRLAEEERAWAAGLAESHLEAVLGVAVDGPVDGAGDGAVRPGALRRFHVVTVVHYRSWAGPVYFNLIRPFHHLVVAGMARSGARAAGTAAPSRS